MNASFPVQNCNLSHFLGTEGVVHMLASIKILALALAAVPSAIGMASDTIAAIWTKKNLIFLSRGSQAKEVFNLNCFHL